MKAALIDGAGSVVNIILADATTDQHPEGFLLVNVDEASPPPIGSTYADGAFTPPPAPPPEIPEAITPRQLRLVLNDQGLLDQVEAFVAQQAKPIQLAWQYASTFLRDDQLLNTMAQQMGITQEQMDQIFIEGASIT